MLKKLAIVTVCFLSVLAPITASGGNGAPGPQFDRKKDHVDIDMEKKMEKARNQDRQKELKQDTEHLLELATELKQYVDKTNENILSVEVIKKAEEIERLAKSVKSRMKESLVTPQSR